MKRVGLVKLIGLAVLGCLVVSFLWNGAKAFGLGGLGKALGYILAGLLIVVLVMLRPAMHRIRLGRALEEAGFHSSQVIKGRGNALYIDEKQGLWYLKSHAPNIYRYEDIAGVEAIEAQEGESRHHHGIRRSLIGYGLAGPLGAIIGSNTSKRKIRMESKNEGIIVSLKDMGNSVLYVYGFEMNAPRVISAIKLMGERAKV